MKRTESHENTGPQVVISCHSPCISVQNNSDKVIVLYNSQLKSYVLLKHQRVQVHCCAKGVLCGRQGVSDLEPQQWLLVEDRVAWIELNWILFFQQNWKCWINWMSEGCGPYVSDKSETKEKVLQTWLGSVTISMGPVFRCSARLQNKRRERQESSCLRRIQHEVLIYEQAGYDS